MKDEKIIDREPQEVTDQLWYYEENKGLKIVHEIRDEETNGYIRTDQIVIPWRKILASVNRYKEWKAKQ